jgi:hypothetical protein
MCGRHVFIAALLWALFPVAGHASSDAYRDMCTYLLQHGYVQMKVDNRGKNNEVVLTRINGQKVKLLIDTGFSRTSVTTACAQRLKLEVRDAGFQVSGTGGSVTGDEGRAQIKSFQLEDREINHTSEVMVLSKTAYAFGIDGYLGFDTLRLNSMIVPVGTNVLFFRPGAGPAVSIKPYMEQLGFKAIPLRLAPDGFRVDGMLNGQAFQALLDCGAQYSAFDLDFINKTKTPVYRLEMMAHGVDGRLFAVYSFIPWQFVLGTFKVPPVPVAASALPSVQKRGADGLLGYDLLGLHRAIIDLGDGTLWMK